MWDVKWHLVWIYWPKIFFLEKKTQHPFIFPLDNSQRFHIHAEEGRQQSAPRHHFSGTGPLRKCTCSHFLLFVWGGLTLAETRASIGTGDDEIRPKDQQTSGPRHRPPVLRCVWLDMWFSGMFGLRRRMEAQKVVEVEDDERWVSDGGWGLFSHPTSLVSPF